MFVRRIESRVERRGRRAKLRGSRWSLYAPRQSRGLRASRRGVLLLVVLSMLVLFMLIGTAFLMTSNQSRTSAKAAAKLNRTGNYATKLLDRAILQVLRDTENPFSAIRYHSLLRDLYGTDGFEAVVYSPLPADFNPTFPTPISQAARYSGAVADIPATPNREDLGPTQGQLVDIFVDMRPGSATPPLPYAVKLERDMFGQTVTHNLSMTKGYYNGCLLTVTNGAAAGGTGRILDYEVAVDPSIGPVIARFRVMGFSRADGTPLEIDAARAPEIGDLAGATFIVNGRAYNGTGVGYNPLAPTGTPRLTAMQLMQAAGGDVVGAEVALTPNSAYLDYATIRTLDYAVATDPFITGLTPTEFLPVNDLTAAPPIIGYPSFDGVGGSDESYDAADFQNLFLALQSVTPRAQGRVVHAGTPPVYYDVSNTAVQNGTDFLRLDLEDVPLPSFHRPELANFWFHRLVRLLAGTNPPTEDHARAVLQPYDTSGNPQFGLSDEQAALITAIKRKISLRPIREDHPNFDGGNPQSRPADLTSYNNLVKNGNIAIPYWEAVGPWDVDNDNDGVPDSIWVDLGDPVTQAEGGTLYKPLYAFLIVDMDSRLNVNAHGLADHLQPSPLDPTGGAPGNLAHDATVGGGLFSSNLLPHGIGYGPAEISLRPLLPNPWANVSGGLDLTLNRAEDSDGDGQRDNSDLPIDSYAALLAGRVPLGGDGIPGKYGYTVVQSPAQGVTPGTNYFFTAATPLTATPTSDVNMLPDLLAQLKFIGYPLGLAQLSAFGTPPDLMGRYPMGLDYAGQPFYEVAYDLNPNAPAAGFANRALLTDSPYEINLSSSSRRDTWANSHNPTMMLGGVSADTNAANLFNQSLVQNDDAPFATADLERVLRAFDADAGTLPSRLWDVVDVFDPVKLGTYDLFRVAATATSAFAGTSDPELLAAAQIMANVARRLATTDSYSLPVPGDNWTQRVLYGMDGLPGIPRDDDDGNGVDDDGQDYLKVVDDNSFVFDPTMPAPCDDYIAVMRTIGNTTAQPFSIEVPQNPGLTDYLRYRILVEMVRRGQIVNGMTAGQVEQAVNQIIHNSGLLAPELIAGLRMDLNRPFGDGQDNGNGIDDDGDGAIDEIGEDPLANGIVDDPLEAGDPFLDVDGDGKFDIGEPFIDLNPGNNNPPSSPYAGQNYDAPRDQLWGNLTSTTGPITEPIAFDHTNGHAEPIRPEAFGGNAAVGVRNLESQARQLYARHLYCLMLLLMDENYIAPWEEIAPGITEPQLKTWMEMKKAALMAAPASLTAEQADFVVKRKLTCRQIAQWAINCVDMRDSDAIMTPFEYDENPWDGWGVPDENNVMVPLDGDPSTDENLAQVIDWDATLSGGGTKVVKPSAPGVTPAVPALPNLNPSPNAVNHTRDLVWGAERPELLITETLAFHDRRTEDLEHTDRNRDGRLNEPPSTPARQDTATDPDGARDLDQRLRPRGSLFVEVYNPWSQDGQRPGELYSLVDPTTNAIADLNGDGVVNGQDLSPGVELGRLSNLDAAGRHSPVWRMIVVNEPPMGRNLDSFDDGRPDVTDQGINLPTGAPAPLQPAAKKAYSDAAKALLDWRPSPNQPLPPFRPTNLDFDGTLNADALPKRPSFTQNRFEQSYPFIEREFYFTSDNSPTKDVEKPAFKLHIPNRSIQLVPTSATRVQTQKFIATQTTTSTLDIPITPILPGRYGVIGSAGTRYDSARPGVFTTTIGRAESIRDGNDSQHKIYLPNTRRIEFWPDPARNANVQQLLVSKNGGDPLAAAALGRDNEMMLDAGGTPINIYDSDRDGVPDPINNQPFQPCVSIPVEGMNISEPPWGYEPRERELAGLENFTASDVPKFVVTPLAPEGAYFSGAGPVPRNETHFNTPFDNAPELMRNGTTPNYRTIHLQRLANPLLPWNPSPGQAGHNAALPVNPYRTIDVSSVDLTAMNGASSMEEDLPPTLRAEQGKFVPDRSNATEHSRFMSNRDPRTGQFRQHWWFKSLERGAMGYLSMVYPHNDSSAAPGTKMPMLPQRSLLSQEPATGSLRDLNTLERGYKQVRDGRDYTMHLVQVPDAVKATTAQDIVSHHMNMVMEHTLGFGNESLGELYDRNTAPTPAAIGAPKRYQAIDVTGNPVLDAGGNQVFVDSTYPWLAWNNRPFVSAQELLAVPAASGAKMFSQFSMVDPNVPAAQRPNPYDGSGGTPATPEINWERVKKFRAPFGNLSNMLATSSFVADVKRDAAGAPELDAEGNVQPYGAPNFSRFLEYVQVPSRFVGTETVLTPEVFNDVPVAIDGTAPNTVGSDILNPLDPRYGLQPPFNKVSQQRDPGKVNLNTVIGRRIPVDPATGNARIWSEVYDGIMHRYRDGAPGTNQVGHLGPAWRDVALSRRGYAQVNAAPPLSVDKPGVAPDTLTFGLNNNFPTFFANPFRSPNAGDLVPLPQMQHYGVDASWLRSHHYDRGPDLQWGLARPTPPALDVPAADDNEQRAVNDPLRLVDDIQEAGFADDQLLFDPVTGKLTDGVLGNTSPLFSEVVSAPSIDTNRNPYMMYQPMTRLGNLVTTRSGVFAIWVTVGYFEVEKAPDWSVEAVRERFGGTMNDTDPATITARALYDRVYPEGYMLAKEVGSETGNTRRQRGFYIIDRTEPVGFKPGEDLNVEKMIRLRRRIE